MAIDDAVLVGEPDALWQLDDGSLFIADFKVARLTDAQKKLLPLYATQLKAYAFLAERHGHAVRGLALVYLEPTGYDDNPAVAVTISAERLTPHFGCHVQKIDDWRSEEVVALVRHVRAILRQPKPPNGKDGCKGCQNLPDWLSGLMGSLQPE